MKKVLFLSAFALALGATAFAGNPKSDVKADAKSTETETKAGTQKYWYRVSYANNTNGEITDASAFYIQGEQSEVGNPCGNGNLYDCLRGFDEPISIFPNTDLSVPSVKTDNQPE